MFTLKRTPDSDQVLQRKISMAKLYIQNRDYRTAKANIDEALAIKPNLGVAYKLLSQINEAMGDNEQATNNYQKFLDLKNSSIDMNSSLEGNVFTPSKFSSPDTSKMIKNQKDAPLANGCTDKAIVQNIQNILNTNLSVFNESVGKIMDALSANTQEIAAVKNTIVGLNSKQQEIFQRLNSVESCLNQNLTKHGNALNVINQTVKTLSTENANILKEFENLRESIQEMSAGRHDDYDYSDEDDEYSNGSDKAAKDYTNQQFKPTNILSKYLPQKPGWECDTCSTQNDEGQNVCAACETPKPGAVQAQQPAALPAFKFGGFPSTTGFSLPPTKNESSPQQPALQPAPAALPNFTSPALQPLPAKSPSNPPPIFGSSSTNTSNPIFGSSSTNANNPSFSFGKPAGPAPQFSFPSLTSTSNAAAAAGFSFTSGKNEPQGAAASFSFTTPNKSEAKSTSPAAPASLFSSLSTAQSTAPAGASAFSSFGQLSGTTSNTNTNTSSPFSFALSKANAPAPAPLFSFPNATKQPEAELKKEDEDKYDVDVINSPENDGPEYFKLPNVKLPENYEQVTGEEEEDVLFDKKGKLYLLVDDEYKERGTGLLKVLKHKETGKIRLLMRRDVIHKVCLNINLTPKNPITFQPKNQKFITFQCVDFSEETPKPGVFLLRFANTDLNNEFMQLANGLMSGDVQPNKVQPTTTSSNDNVGSNATTQDDDDVQIVFEKLPTPANAEKAKRLMLPPLFFEYDSKPKCPGCIGCDDENVDWNTLTKPREEPATVTDAGSSNIFANLVADIKVEEKRMDTISASPGGGDFEEKSFVSEKSKLLPEKFEVKTGEEEEDVMFTENARLFRFVDEEWKERGRGVMKILKRKDKDEYRLLMRRDVMFNVICNQNINLMVGLKKRETPNTLFWAAIDFSEVIEGEKYNFIIRFKNETIATTFMDFIEAHKKKAD